AVDAFVLLELEDRSGTRVQSAQVAIVDVPLKPLAGLLDGLGLFGPTARSSSSQPIVAADDPPDSVDVDVAFAVSWPGTCESATGYASVALDGTVVAKGLAIDAPAVCEAVAG